ncbi:glucanase b [Aureobasidium subglaciale]|nr:glucanase b [Aureobasidium subglaciale]KAI5219841.1 glucanase b [Aureobasidium subglaciale]KAI5223644.1 glucanase b [Aureobasidium subglaciale]KAI5260549.1 glucanase b [Aureobasidium subglaciale]
MPDSLHFLIKNDTDSLCYAYLTGFAIQYNLRRCFLKSDGRSLFFPTSSGMDSPRTTLDGDCAISIAACESFSLQVPQLSGGRLWISKNDRLAFFLDPGPQLVEPSVTNLTDANNQIDFSFVEFTLNEQGLYANISYVDFVGCLSVGLELLEMSGNIQKVKGLAPGGIDEVANGLREQSRVDGFDWTKLVVTRDSGGGVSRILNATNAKAVGADFGGYFEPYVDQVWKKYDYTTGCGLEIDTQLPQGVLTGSVNSAGLLDFGPGLTFTRPCTADIFGCNSGPFITGDNQVRNALIPRLAAGFVRSTLFRLIHKASVDGKGYGFAYDDVDPKNGTDQSGKVNSGTPVGLTIVVVG